MNIEKRLELIDKAKRSGDIDTYLRLTEETASVPNSKTLRIIDVGNQFGNMNYNLRFFPKHFTQEDADRQFDMAREQVGLIYGFNGDRMYMADQTKQDGSYFEITPDYVEANPEGWSDIPEDILVMSSDVEQTAIGHPVADCPVVIAYDKRKKVVAIGHCSMALVDKLLPVAVVDALLKSHDSKDEDIVAFVGPGAKKESYIYETYPSKNTNDKLWEKRITENPNGGFNIDLQGAITDQLEERNIQNIIVSPVDTIKHPGYYSNYGEKHGDESKAGRNFTGATFNTKRR